MKAKRSNPLLSVLRSFSATTAIVISFIGAAQAGTLYWDANLDAAGSGDLGGTWDAGTNWTTDTSGLSTTVGWTDGENVVFSTGTDGTGAWEVTIAGTVATPWILFGQAGAKTISGGTITIGGGIINTAAAGNGNTLTISSALAGASGGLTVTANGDISDSGGGVGGATVLSGANTITGDITINGGIVRSNSSFGNAANKVILSGGGISDSNLNTNFTRNLEIPATKTGIYRTYGGVTTGQISGAITGAGTLRHTDGGTLTLSGDGSAFTGILNNARGNLTVSTANWAGTHFVGQDGSNLRFNAGGTTTIKSYEGDRDVFINAGNLLDIATGTFKVTNGATVNGFWV